MEAPPRLESEMIAVPVAGGLPDEVADRASQGVVAALTRHWSDEGGPTPSTLTAAEIIDFMTNGTAGTLS